MSSAGNLAAVNGNGAWEVLGHDRIVAHARAARVRMRGTLAVPADAREHVVVARPGAGGLGLDASAAPLVGREREIGALHAALDAALAGSGRIVLLGGEPGIGKTRLASVLAAEVRARGVPVCWGRGWEDGSAPAFWPWTTALQPWIESAGREALLAAAGPRAADLVHVFPVLRDRIPGVPSSESWESGQARFRLFDAVGRFLAAVAAPEGLVVVLDDLHWADRPTLKLLEFIAADLRDARVLVVGTYRDTEVQRENPFSDTLSRLAREPSTGRLVVAGLSAAHCAQWVALAGARADADSVGGVLHRETNGNPFFLGEIVRLLASEGRLDTGLGGQLVPPSVSDVVSRRVARLGEGCRAMLGVAALLGDTIDAPIVSEILEDLGQDLRQGLGQDLHQDLGEEWTEKRAAAASRVADQLRRAAVDRILVADQDRQGRYTFAHALIRRVLADALEPSARAAWHARIAAVLERHAVSHDVAPTELVRHFAAAGTPEALRKAFEHACRSGEEAARNLGWEEAVRLYEIALDVGGRSGLVDAKRAIELRLAVARALRGAGDVVAARARCDEVMAACRRTPDPGAFAQAALIYAGAVPEFGRVEPAVRARLEEACGAGPGLDDALRARLHARLAGDLIAANEVDQGERVFALCEEAAAVARRVGAPGVLALALTGKYYAAAMGMRPGASCGAVPSSQEILEAAEAGREHEFAAAIRHARATTLFAIGEPEAFTAEVDGLATAAAASRVPEALWLADALAAMRATVQGRFGEAQDAMERAVATGRRMQLSNAVGVYVSQRIMWHAFQGRLAEIGPEIEAFVDEHPGGPGWRPFRALARLASGDVVAARAEFQSLLAAGLAPADRGVMARCYLAGLAALCVALRDRENAPVLYDRVARRRDVWSVDGCETLGPWALVLGALARLCGRPADAVQHWERAIQLGRHMQSRPIVARAQSLLASVRLSMQPGADERTRIAAMLAEAAQCARELGLVDVTARVERVRARLAATAGSRSNAFRRDGDVWTVRYDGRDLRLKDGKGPRYLATLLAAPGRECHVLQLAGMAAAPAASAAHDGLSIGLPGGCIDDAPDERARSAYRARLDELRRELDEAERFADLGRAERLRDELDLLATQLAGRFGARTARRGPAETARKAVTKVLRTQIGKLLDLQPSLGRHLRDTVRMGTLCAYAPQTPVEWDISFGSE